MAMQVAFNPTGKTIVLNAGKNPPTGVRCPSQTKSNQYRIFNSGDEVIFFAFGETAEQAKANATLPLDSEGQSAFSIPIPAGGIEVLSAAPDSFLSAYTADEEDCLVYVTPGEGI